MRRRSFAPRGSLPVGRAASCSNTYATCSTPPPRGVYGSLYGLAQHVAAGRVPPLICRLFGSSCKLALTKPAGDARTTAIGEVVYHFLPHQFSVATPAGAESVIHALWAALDLHPDRA